MKSQDRSLLPATKISQVDISFLDGKFNLSKEPVYDNRTITVNMSFVSNDLKHIQNKKREIAGWLSGGGQLVFDDEPNKFYNANIFQSLSFAQDNGRVDFSISFECDSFALSSPTIQTEMITQQNQECIVNIVGNVKTGGTITLSNSGNTTLNNIKISRNRGKDT